MHLDIRRLAIGTLGTVVGHVAELSSEDAVRLFGVLASIATIIYMSICSAEKLGFLKSKSRSKSEQDPEERL